MKKQLSEKAVIGSIFFHKDVEHHVRIDEEAGNVIKVSRSYNNCKTWETTPYSYTHYTAIKNAVKKGLSIQVK